MERARLKAWVEQLTGAVTANGCVFLRDPSWGAVERGQAAELIEANPDSVESGWLCVATGGTSGRVRFVRHDEQTLASAVSGFCTHFGLERVNAVNVLPAHHVSGLMARVRAWATGGSCVNADWKDLVEQKWPNFAAADGRWCLSLVPTQLQRLMELSGGADFLRRFAFVFIGGAPLWPALADAAASAGIRVSLCYGMTETAAMITAQMPEDFLNGARGVGKPMPHVSIDLLHDGERNGDASGRIKVTGESVFRGYFPNLREPVGFVTGDVGEFLDDGQLRLIGRSDAVIISGGKKVWPGEVEHALRNSGVFTDVAVIGVPDPQWGERVVCCHPGGLTAAGLTRAQAALADLAKWKHPKQYLAVTPWPKNAQGKVNRSELLAVALET